MSYNNNYKKLKCKPWEIIMIIWNIIMYSNEGV